MISPSLEHPSSTLKSTEIAEFIKDSREIISLECIRIIKVPSTSSMLWILEYSLDYTFPNYCPSDVFPGKTRRESRCWGNPCSDQNILKICAKRSKSTLQLGPPKLIFLIFNWCLDYFRMTKYVNFFNSYSKKFKI